MGLNSLRKGASGGFLKIILFGILTMAVGGLVMMDVGGVFRGGVSFGDVAKVGDEPVTINEFDRTVRSTLNRVGLSPQQAYQFGYINQILGSQLRGRVLAQAARNKNIVIPDEKIALTIKQMIDPIALREGEDPKDILDRMLLSQGMSEAGFVQSMKNEDASNLLSSAIQAGLSSPSPALIRALYAEQNETRNVAFISFLDSKLTKSLEPTDDQLETLYNATKEQYASPERRVIQIATIDTKRLKETLDISDEAVLAEYENNIDFYTVDKTQTIDQALLDTEEDAKAVLQEAKSGKSLKAAVETATGKLTAYLGEQTLEDNELIETIKDEVLGNQDVNALIGPLQSPLGWYVVQIKKITAAHTQSFDEVKEDIKDLMMEELLFDQEYDLANTVDDLLASGSSLNEVKETVELKMTTIPAVDRSGIGANDSDAALKDFEDEKALILETAFGLGLGETSNVIETDGGVFLVVHVEEIQDKQYPEFATVKTDIAQKWLLDQRRIENRILVKETLEELKTSGQSLKAFAAAKGRIMSRRDKLSRDAELEAPLQARTVANIFEAPINEPFIVGIEGGAAIAVVQGFDLPQDIDETSDGYLELVSKVQRDTQNEALILYLTKQQNEIGVSVNNDLINRVYGPDSQLTQ